MADSPPPPPAPTTITALGDDLLREIFLRLPSVTSVARAAFACRAFLRAVRSSPAFRRRFRELHAPPLLALFLPAHLCPIVPAAAGEGSDIATAFADLLQHSGASDSEWRSDPEIPYFEGYAFFVNQATDQSACYSPHSQALNIYPKNLRYVEDDDAFLEFHTLSPDGDEQLPSRVVCVHRDHAWAWARVAVFSLHTMEWQVVLPETNTGGPVDDNDRCSTGTVVNGFVCWVHRREGCILALNTVTFQFSRMDLPPPLRVPFSRLGHTKDGKFCVVNVLQCTLSVWLLAADDDGVERFMLHKTFSLLGNVSEVTEHSKKAYVRMQPMAVINGFVYLCAAYFTDTQSPSWFLSCCLETAEVNLLHNHKRDELLFWSVDPYIMVNWPSSLIHGKDSETGVPANISKGDGPMGKDETSPALFTALQLFKEKLIDDGNSKFTEIESFLLDDKRDSLLNIIATLESGFAAARDRVLRIGTESDRMNGMERVSYWQMCKGMLGRACSRLFTG